ncbi:MAG: hypothetical protein R3F08_01685 [Dokdonella sp.]
MMRASGWPSSTRLSERVRHEAGRVSEQVLQLQPTLRIVLQAQLRANARAKRHRQRNTPSSTRIAASPAVKVFDSEAMRNTVLVSTARGSSSARHASRPRRRAARRRR